MIEIDATKQADAWGAPEWKRQRSTMPPWGGINYDIGNSAALGYSVEEEFVSYGNRIVNVHVKDRVLGGTTVALGAGAAQFEKVFGALDRMS